MTLKKKFAPLFLVLLLAGLLPAQTEVVEKKYPQGEPATLAGFKDEARFIIIVNEERLGTTESSWKAEGSYSARTELHVAGQTITRSTRITPDADGRWKEVVLELPQGRLVFTRQGTEVTRAFQDKTSTFQTRRDVTVQDISSVALHALTLRRYDRVKGGKQQFPVFVFGAGGQEVTLELLETVERSFAGREEQVAKFRWSMPGADIFVYADRDGRVLLLDAMAVQKAVIVREGYEALFKPPAPDPLVSAPEFEVTVEKNVMVPMRDGVTLATDIYRPVGVERAPVVLVRTPYQKNMQDREGRYFARRGYVYAAQDCRGLYASQGTWEPFVHEAADGYDTVEWLAAKPWSTGKVGMIGASYVGWVQWWAASARPPHLTTIIPNVAPPDPLHNIPYENGAFFLWGAIWWANVLESKAAADASGAALSQTFNKKYGQLLKALPVIDLDKAVLGKENPYWRQWIAHPTNDAYWQPANFLDKLKDVNIPVFHQSGWYDGDAIGTKLNYLRMTGCGHRNQKLIVGPWGHTPTAMRVAGDREFGPAAMMDLERDYLRWFDYWLKGRDSKILTDPLVQIFVMNSEKWLKADSYPLPETKFTKLYLASSGKANTSKGDGKLSFAVPPAKSPTDTYAYDPGDPTPDPRMYEESEADEKRVRTVEERRKEAESYHGRVIEQRRDILVYVTDPFEKALTFAGPVSAKLYASSSAKDTDWFVLLSEITPEGKIRILCQGKVRARFRDSLSKPTPLKPGRIYEYTLDLWHTGITMQKGSRLQVEIASAAFPLFSRNLNTGGHNEIETKYITAQQVIYHDAQHPSHLLLPVIPEQLRASGSEPASR